MPRVSRKYGYRRRWGGDSMIFAGHLTGPEPKEPTVPDLLYIGLTIVVFAVLFLIVKGVERFER